MHHKNEIFSVWNIVLVNLKKKLQPWIVELLNVDIQFGDGFTEKPGDDPDPDIKQELKPIEKVRIFGLFLFWNIFQNFR